MSSRKPAKEKRSPSSDASAPPPKSASSSRRSTATPVGDDARPNVSSKPSSSATLEARRPTSRLARSSTSNSNAETDDTPKPVSAGNRKTRRSSSVSSLEGSLIGDPVDDRPSRHASSSLSDQSSKSPSPPPATVRQTSSQPNSAKRSPPKRVELTPVDSSSEDDTDASQSFTESFTNQGRGRARPRGAQRPPTKSNPRRAPTSATSSRGRLSPPPEFYAPARATRATVALPPGYIEGVKSTRMPRRADSAKAESSGVDDDVRPKKGVPKGKAKEQELEEERQKERERARERELELEREEQEREAELELEQQAARKLELERKREREREQEEEEEREREQEPERLTSKRRKLDEENAAALTASRQRLLDQLDDETELIHNATHPLLQHTYDRLDAEKAMRLSHLRDVQALQEAQIDLNLEVETEAVWRQWADEKDSLRMELYFSNHDHLKKLIGEEREYPFLRDHPLLINMHGLAPMPYYRAPLPPPVYGEARRSLVKTTAHLDAPPVNRALDHSTWQLTPSEVATDLALFAECINPSFNPRNYAMTIEQPYGAVHYAPASTPPVFQPPSASLAASLANATYFSAHAQHATTPRLPHDMAMNRPPNIFPQPSTLAPRWPTPGSSFVIPPRKGPVLAHPHPPMQNKPVNGIARVSPAATTNAMGPPSYAPDPSYRPRVDAESANWFTHPLNATRPADPPLERRLNPAPRQDVNVHSQAPRVPPVVSQNHVQRPTPPAVPPPVKKPTESWMDWRPTPRGEPASVVGHGKPNAENPRPFQVFDRPPSTTPSTSAFAAYEPQAIPSFGAGKLKSAQAARERSGV